MERDKLGRFMKGISASSETQFKEGQKPWNKGLNGYKNKIGNYSKKSGFQKGHKNYNIKVSEETKEKLKESKLGNTNGFKKGKDNLRYTGYLHKKYKIKQLEWLAIRQLILERDSFKCQNCGRNHHETLLDVHHKIPYRISQDNYQNNLITLCRSCHIKIEQVIIKELQLKAKAGGNNL